MLVSGLTGIDIDLATAMHRTKAESHGLKPGFHKDFGAKMEVCPKISSSVFQDNSAIPVKYTCDGLDINPPAEIRRNSGRR